MPVHAVYAFLIAAIPDKCIESYHLHFTSKTRKNSFVDIDQ